MHIIDVTVVWQTMLFIFGGLWLLSWLWAKSLARGLQIRRMVRFGWAQVGDQLEEKFELVNNSWASALWISIEDYSNLPGHKPGRVTGISGNSRTEWRFSIECLRRGLFQLGPLKLKTGDPLGIYEVTKIDSSSQTLLITPPVVALPGIHVAQGGRAGEGKLIPQASERSVSSSGVRGYLPGDNLHLIHWPTSVRKQGLFVRLFDTTETGDWRILLDLNRNVQVGENPEDTIEHGIILAASLVSLAFRSNHPVGLILNGEELTWISPSNGEQHRWDIMKALALAQPGEFSLKEVLDQLSGQLRDRSSLVIITSDTMLEWLPPLIKLSWRGVIPTIVLIDGAEFISSEQKKDIPEVSAASRILTSRGYFNQIVPKKLTSDIASGKEGVWEWKSSPQGKAIAVRKPHDLTWRELL